MQNYSEKVFKTSQITRMQRVQKLMNIFKRRRRKETEEASTALMVTVIRKQDERYYLMIGDNHLCTMYTVHISTHTYTYVQIF